MIDQESPDSIDTKEIEREKDDRYQRNDRCVLYFVQCRPRDAPHLAARIAQELARARNKSRGGRRAARTPPAAVAATRGQHSALGLLWRRAARCFRHLLARRLTLEFEFVVAHANVV